MSSTILNITFDCADPATLARFWGQVTGWPVIEEPNPGHPDRAVGTLGEGRPRLYFVKVPESKAVKNRVHLDVMPADRGPGPDSAPAAVLPADSAGPFAAARFTIAGGTHRSLA